LSSAFANAKRHIKAAPDEIDHFVIAHEIDLEPWMATNQLRHERSDVPLVEGDRAVKRTRPVGCPERADKARSASSRAWRIVVVSS
jgi:hypothetical protein